MSLHVHLSEEAHRRLEAQKRHSSITAIFISILTVCLVGTILGTWMLVHVTVPDSDHLTVLHTTKPEAPDSPEIKRQTPQVTKPIPPRNSIQSRIIHSEKLTPISLPQLDETTILNLGLGNHDEFSIEIGDTQAFDQDGFKPLQPNGPMRNRCSAENRMRRIQETGGNPACETAVTRALDFFKHTQNPDGSWDKQYQPAMTGLVLLAYLGHCETPKSTKYGDTVERAINYLVNLGLKNDGKLTSNLNDKHWCYEHAIATYALGEAYALCTQAHHPIPNLERITQNAGQLIVDRQGPNGGWGYGYHGDGDLSIIGWQLQALKAVDHSGLKLEQLQTCIRKAMKRIEKHQSPDGGFNYRSNGNTARHQTLGYRNLTGVGTLSMQIWGHGQSKSALNGIQYIANHSQFDFDQIHSDLYGLYYDAQAMIHHGGKEWANYNHRIRDQLLSQQLKDGSFPAPKFPLQIQTPTYRTAIITLTLEVYYRFLPSADGSH